METVLNRKSAFVVIHLVASRGQARLRHRMRTFDSVTELRLSLTLKIFSVEEQLNSF